MPTIAHDEMGEELVTGHANFLAYLVGDFGQHVVHELRDVFCHGATCQTLG